MSDQVTPVWVSSDIISDGMMYGTDQETPVKLEPKLSGSGTGRSATGNNRTNGEPLGHVLENVEDRVDNPDVTIELGGMDDTITNPLVTDRTPRIAKPSQKRKAV